MRKIFLSLILIIFLIGIISAEVSYCCEKTLDLDSSTPGYQGGWCLNAPENECDTGFRAAPTSCEATSYCKLGTCINTNEGNCMPNTPQKVCEDNDGIWNEGTSNEIPQCTLGCCLIGEQAAFVTQTRCKKLSSIYGLEVNYRTDIQTEAECILSATSDVKGACVFEIEFERNCEMITREECQKMPDDYGAEFHEGYLCSATSLNTICGARGGTTCVEGRDEVFFKDTCGNLANVYDSDKLNDENYWTYIAGYGGVVVDCGSGSNANSQICGDCDYFLGSTCQKGNVQYGDFVCKDLGCYEGTKKIAEHGETWCAESSGTSKIIVDENYEVTSSGTEGKVDVPGSRYFRLLCYDGEITVEPCAEYRQEICLETEVNGFRAAACRVNKWQDCLAQDSKKDCENNDQRDCKWINEDKEEINLEDGERGCVPRNAPGFNFWEEGDAEEICALGSSVCVVTIKRSMEGETSDFDLDEGGDFSLNKLGTLRCEKNCKCLTPEMAKKLGGGGDYINGYSKSEHDKWLKNQLQYCSALGDCGVSVNFIGEDGYLEQSDYQNDLVIS